jgi:hypothetical protein
MGIGGIALDCDYTTIRPSFTRIVRPFYRLGRSISDRGIEELVRFSHTLLGSWMQYVIEDAIYKFPITSTPILQPAMLLRSS